MPATPMNEAAERYSPEIAEAFQPTDTERPATKKSLAVFEVFAERKPIQSVIATVMNENPKIHGSTPPKNPLEAATNKVMFMAQFPSRSFSTCRTSSSSSQMERRIKIHDMAQTAGKKSTPNTSHASVKPKMRVAINCGAK